MSEEQQESQTGDAGTTPEQPQTDWESVADAAASTPNPLYVTSADVYDPPADAKAKVIGRCKMLWQIAGPVFFAINVFLLCYYVSQVTTLCGEFGAKNGMTDLVRTELKHLGLLPESPGSPLRMGPPGPPGPPGSPGEKGPMGPACTAKPLTNPHAAYCPRGYRKFRETCYKAFITPKTFISAAATCRADGGTLAMPRDAETDAFLTSLSRSLPTTDQFWWFGLHDQFEEGRFEWVDGSALGTYSAWGPEEPDDSHGNFNCVAYGGRGRQDEAGRWFVTRCDYPSPFICQVIPGHTSY